MNLALEEAIAKSDAIVVRMKTEEPIEALVKDICAYLPDLDGETCLAWITRLIAGRPKGAELPKVGEPQVGPRQPDAFDKRLQQLNVALNKTREYVEAVTRLHAWKETQKKTGEG